MRLIDADALMDALPSPIEDEYRYVRKVIDAQPTVKAADAEELIDELLKLGYPHNFQGEAPHIRNYMYAISEIIDKAYRWREKL